MPITRRAIVGLLHVAAFLGALVPAQAADHVVDAAPFMEPVAAPKVGMLILLRHADRNRGETELNDTGRARAAALPAALAGLGIDAIYHTDFARNADTAAPLAAATGLTPEVFTPDETLSRRLVAAATGRGVVWIGNVNNLVDLWDALGLEGPAPTRYGSVAVLTAEDGDWRLDWRHHGP
ncbi:MAG: histidine phosphatase family protein [Pseudomonadota bacterium]